MEREIMSVPDENNNAKLDSRTNSRRDFIASIGNILKESWQLVWGMKGVIFILGILLPLVYIVLLVYITVYVIVYIFVAIAIMGLSKLLFVVPIALFFLILLYYGLFCILTLLIMLGVRRAIGLSFGAKTICIQFMREFGDTFMIFLLWFVTIASMIFLKYLIPDHQVIFFIIENIIVNYGILFPLLSFALPLVIIKRCGVIDAIAEAYHILRKNGLSYIICSIIMGLILFVSAIPVGIGLIWTVPMAVAMQGIFFRNATGLSSIYD